MVANPAPIGKGFPEIARPIDGDLVYSHYDDNGNTRSIVQLDFTTGRWSNLVHERTNPKLIAQNSQYTVFHTPHTASYPIEVVSRKTGESISRIRLSKPVQDAYIDGDRLVLFQGSTAPYSFQQAIAILELPSLKLIQEIPLPGFYLIGNQNNKIYTAFSANAKSDVMVYDHHFKELGRFVIPESLEKINLSCRPEIHQQEGDRVLLVSHCGEIHVVNLKNFSIERTIPRYANLYSIAFNKGLIFTVPESQNVIVVFDMDSGKELARLPIMASHIFMKGNTLLAVGNAVSTGRDASWPMETYRINSDAIRSGMALNQSVMNACAKASDLVKASKDVYQAIKLCDDAGIKAV